MATKKKAKKVLRTSPIANGGQQFMSPKAKKIAIGKGTTSQKISKLTPKGTKDNVRRGVAKAIGSQKAKTFISKTQSAVVNTLSKKNTKGKQTRKPSVGRKPVKPGKRGGRKTRRSNK